MKTITGYIKTSPFFIKLLNWEYWNFHLIYLPVYPLFFWLIIKARNPFFFMAANKGMCDDNLLTENKRDVYNLIPDAYKPHTLFFNADTAADEVLASINQNGLNYPLIIKPNVGARGRGVQILYNQIQLTTILNQYNNDFIIQPFIDYPEEIGLFFVRLPGECFGQITGIVHKKFMTVTGDGVHTCLELLTQNQRYVLQIQALKMRCPELLLTVLDSGKEQILMPYGNHSRGCLFTDHSYMTDLKLTHRINKIIAQIPGFNYGRLDIRYSNWDDLLNGRNFCIIELNGAASEPTHIYDPGHSLIFAWKEICRHWNLLYRISVANNSIAPGYPLFKDGWHRLSNTFSYETALNKMKV